MIRIAITITVLAWIGYSSEVLPAADAGKQLAQSKRCGDCHGATGISPEGTSYPNLAGQKVPYLKAALTAYRDKTREHPLMSGMAQGLSDKDIESLAEYFSSLPSCP